MPPVKKKAVYASKYTSRKVTAGQLAAERACERKAKQDGRTLPPRFWETEAWKAEFKKNVTSANALVKEFGAEAVLAVFGRRDLEWCTSLSCKQWRAGVVDEHRRLQALPPPPQPVEPPPTTPVLSDGHSVFAGKKSIRGL